MTSGQITDINGPTIPGANVYLSDANGNMLQPAYGVATDANGNYTVDTKNASYITATFVGMTPKTKPVAAVVNFELYPSGSAQLNVAEVSAKKPIPWQLIISVSVFVGGMIYFIIKISKDIKKNGKK